MATADRLAPATPPKRRDPQTVGVVMYLIAAFLFAVNGVLAKSAMEVGLSPLRLTELRNAGSMVLLVVIGLTLLGLALVAQIRQGGTLDPLGVVAGLVLAFALALYWILGESGQSHRDALSLTMWGFVFSTAAWSIIAPWPSYPFEVLTRTAAPMFPGAPGLPVWLIMALGVAFGTVTPFLLVLGSLRRLGAARAGIIGTTEPVWAAILAMAFLGEMLTPLQGIGGLIVVVGIIVAETSRAPAATTGEFPIPGEDVKGTTTPS